ncbi:MAG: amidohydrolase [Betaproteobacteria bacterium]|nr:amidohydrolase [Betaproteobacteria bacterium]
MYIVDSQVHIWGANTPERPWPPGRHQPHRPVPFSKDDLLREMDAAGVHRVVTVPPGYEGERNDLVLEAARLHPDRFAIMGRINAEAPESRGTLATWRRQPGMLGLRLSFWRKIFRPILAEGRADWLWEEAEEAGVPIMVFVDHEQVRFIDRVAERHPGLKLVMDHLCLAPGTKDDEAFVGLDEVLALAKRPNIAVKASALPCYTNDTYPYRRVHPYVRRVYDAFGPQRIFWGTDLTRLPCSYRQAITMFTENIPWFTAHDKEWIMGRGVCEWLEWELPQSKTPARPSHVE